MAKQGALSTQTQLVAALRKSRHRDPSGTALEAQRVAALGMDAATRVATPGHGTVWLARSPQRRSPPA